MRTIPLCGSTWDEKRHPWAILAHVASLTEKVADRLFHHVTADLGNRLRQWNIFGTDLDAVLSVAAFLDASIAHQGDQTLPFQRCARRMRIEEANLRNCGRADEAGVLVELRAGFHTTTAGDTTRKRIR